MNLDSVIETLKSPLKRDIIQNLNKSFAPEVLRSF